MTNENYRQLAAAAMATGPTKAVLDEVQDVIFLTADDAGWHDKPRTFGDVIALTHSELSEALEEYRNDRQFSELYYLDSAGEETTEAFAEDGTPHKTEGIAAELADVMVRVLDAAGEFQIPVVEALLHKMQYNTTRAYRHGGKKL